MEYLKSSPFDSPSDPLWDVSPASAGKSSVTKISGSARNAQIATSCDRPDRALKLHEDSGLHMCSLSLSGKTEESPNLE